MRRGLPTGTVTFLFTDVEGSTKLLHELGPSGLGRLRCTSALCCSRSLARGRPEKWRGALAETYGETATLLDEDA